jgi:hypothetical protein
LPPRLMRCVTSTNIVESQHGEVRLRTRRIYPWRGGRRVLRPAAAVFLFTEKGFRKIQGYRDLWILKALLNPGAEEKRRTQSNKWPQMRDTTAPSNGASDTFLISDLSPYQPAAVPHSMRERTLGSRPKDLKPVTVCEGGTKGKSVPRSRCSGGITCVSSAKFA